MRRANNRHAIYQLNFYLASGHFCTSHTHSPLESQTLDKRNKLNGLGFGRDRNGDTVNELWKCFANGQSHRAQFAHLNFWQPTRESGDRDWTENAN